MKNFAKLYVNASNAGLHAFNLFSSMTFSQENARLVVATLNDLVGGLIEVGFPDFAVEGEKAVADHVKRVGAWKKTIKEGWEPISDRMEKALFEATPDEPEPWGEEDPLEEDEV